MSDLINIEYLKSNTEVIPLSTAIIALLGLLATTIFRAVLDWIVNKRKIKAEVISKSRVEWIQDVRSLTGEYINDAQYFTTFIFSLPYYRQNMNKDELNDELNIRHSKFLSTKHKLTMYFPIYSNIEHVEKEKINKENKDINDIIHNMYLDIKRFSDYVIKENKLEGFVAKNKGDQNTFIEKHYNLLNLNMSTYLKKEWIMAKKNK